MNKKLGFNTKIDGKIIAAINDKYIMTRSKYLTLDKNGNYYTKKANKENKIPSLNDRMIEQHLKGQVTYGVFSGEIYSKVLIFDVDVPENDLAKQTVYKIIDTLVNFKIDKNKIYCTWSGNKGYHVTLFTPIVRLDQLKQLFNATLNQAELKEIDCGQVEMRPLDTNGVKLPLGKQFKNKDDKNNTCYFCDIDNELKLIKDKSYILKTEKLNENEFDDLMFYLENEELIHNPNKSMIDARNEYEDKITEIKETVNPLPSYNQNTKERDTLEAITKLESEGLQYPSSRYNSLLKIAKYYKTYYGVDKEECAEMLIKWMGWQDKCKYKSSWEQCLKDINNIVKYIYEKDIRLIVSDEELDIEISRREMDCIMKIKKKSQSFLLFALLRHSKRYATKQGIFYMSYRQMAQALDMTENGAYLLFKKFETDNSNLIEVVERNQRVQDKTGKVIGGKPNKYRLKLDVLEYINESNEDIKVIVNNEKLKGNCILLFKNVACEMFNNKEIVKLCSRSMSDELRAHKLTIAG